MRTRIVGLVLVGLFGLLLGAVAACGTDPVGVDSCRRIEHARCENAPSCGIDLSKPIHRGDGPERDVTACIRYYEDACLHGLVVTEDPGAVVVDACIEAIHTGDCSVVKKPETHPSCAFLAPPPPPPPPTDAAAGG